MFEFVIAMMIAYAISSQKFWNFFGLYHVNVTIINIITVIIFIIAYLVWRRRKDGDE